MITGTVNSNREAIIIVKVYGPFGTQIEVEGIIDTGFNGSLTLPSSIVEELGLEWRTKGSSILANGQIDECDIYAGRVVWNETIRNILVESSETNPLVGMGLIYGHEMVIRAIDGGSVSIYAFDE